METERSVLLTGKPSLPKEPVELEAGRLTVRYENGSIRYIKIGDVEILRMIYAAVRDPNWGTVEPVIRDEKIDKHPDSFHIHYIAEYHRNDIFFEAGYSISGSSEGIRFTMHGSARSSFQRNRIGFCVLHPVKECAGKACMVKHPDGSHTSGVFPQYINPHQPFKNIQSMSWQPAAGIQAEIVYAGDIFEMEDQRNWSDASYKTYCTPLELPFPVLVNAGQVIEQSVELNVHGEAKADSGSAPIFSISHEKVPIPQLGVGASYLKKSLAASSASLLKQLKLHHYRFDINLVDEKWPSDAAREFANAAALHARAEVALHIDPSALTAFTACVKQIKAVAQQVFCFIVFNTEKKSTDGALLHRIVPVLRSAFPEASIGAGSDCFFAELNREPTPTALIDFLSFSVNPQVHAVDNQSLTETLESHRNLVESAQRFANGKAIHVSSVTFKMRFNPNATGPEPEPAPGELPSTVDPRQLSLYGAAWTLGSIKHLAESGAKCITYFETIGWRGLLQGDQDSELPEKFAAVKGQVFPLWQIFKWVLEFKDGRIIPVTSSQPLMVDGLMLQNKDKRRLLVANYSLKPQNLPLPEIADRISVLDERSAESFSQKPGALQTEKFRQNHVSLLPYAVACIDF
jgi:hypothetical protein